MKKEIYGLKFLKETLVTLSTPYGYIEELDKAVMVFQKHIAAQLSSEEIQTVSNELLLGKMIVARVENYTN